MKKNILITALLYLSFSLHALEITPSIIDDACGSCTGSIKINAKVSGSYISPNFLTYEWSNGDSTQTSKDLCAGFYTVTVTDTSGTQTIETFEVLNNNSLSLYSDGYNICEFTNEYVVNVNLYNGVPPYSYEYNGLTGSFSNNFENIFLWSNASDTLYITDATGCAGEQFVDIYPADVFPIASVQNDCQSSNVGAITVDLLGNSGPNQYNLDWSDGFNQSSYGPLYVHDNLGAGTYSVTITSMMTNCQYVLQNIVIEDMGTDCSIVSGNVYADTDANCSYSSSVDVLIPNVILSFQPGEYYTSTDENGEYSIGLPYGNYSITEAGYYALLPSCTATQPLEVDLNSSTPYINNFNIANYSDSIPNLGIYTSSGIPRPGFQYHQTINFSNNSFFNINNSEIELSFNPILTLTSSSLAYNNITSNSISWIIPSTDAYEHYSIYLNFYIPADAGLIGDSLNSLVQINLAGGAPDFDMSDNTSEINRVIQGAYDPNFIEINNIANQDEIFLDDSTLTYTIHFQNTGTDTAFNISVVDTIPVYLDLLSFVASASSHNYTCHVLNGRRVEFTFDNILLVDSNTNEPLSHAYVSYSIKQDLNNEIGDFIDNKAYIYFDYNSAIITNNLHTEIIDNPLFIEENKNIDHQFTITPIPANDFITISFGENKSGIIEIYNISGQKIIETNYSNKKEFRLSVQNLDKGVYIVKNKQQNIVESKRIVIN